MGRVRLPIILGFVFAFLLSAGIAFAAPGDAVPGFGGVIDGATPKEVVEEIIAENPNAVVLVPETEAEAIASDDDGKIVSQDANVLNTVILGLDFGYENFVILVMPKYTWLQSLATVGFNTVWLKQMNLKVGRWSQIMQAGGAGLSTGLTKLKIISQEKWQNRMEAAGNFITHTGMVYGIYALWQTLGRLPNLRNGFWSETAQLNILRKAGLGYFSGLGWALAQRKWDAMPDDERPISRQAFMTFNTVRGLVLGVFMPFLISTPSSDTTRDFLIHNSPFIASAVMGSFIYLFGDPILKRYPKIGEAVESFDFFTQRLNDRMTEYRDRIKYRVSRARHTICDYLVYGATE